MKFNFITVTVTDCAAGASVTVADCAGTPIRSRNLSLSSRVRCQFTKEVTSLTKPVHTLPAQRYPAILHCWMKSFCILRITKKCPSYYHRQKDHMGSSWDSLKNTTLTHFIFSKLNFEYNFQGQLNNLYARYKSRRDTNTRKTSFLVPDLIVGEGNDVKIHLAV